MKYIVIASLLLANGSLLAFDEKTSETGCNPGGNGGVIAATTVLAQVDGVKLTLADYERKHPGAAMFQARNTFYESQRKAVEEFVSEYLLDRQAQKEHLTVAELLDFHVNKTIAQAPSDEALRLYYEGVDTNESFDVAKPKILEYVMQRRISKAKATYLQSLKKRTSSSCWRLRGLRWRSKFTAEGRRGAPVVLVVEGMVGLGRVTKDKRYLEEAKRIAGLAASVTNFDALHSHGRLCAVRGFADLYALTGEQRWREAAERDWHIFASRYSCPRAGSRRCWNKVRAGRRLRRGRLAAAEPFAVAVDGEGRYLDAAERSLKNHFIYQQFPNGGAGHRLVVESTWRALSNAS